MSGYVVVFEGDAFGNSGPLGPRRQSGDQRDSYPEMPADRVMVPRRAGVCRSAGWWRGGWWGGAVEGGAVERWGRLGRSVRDEGPICGTLTTLPACDAAREPAPK